MRLVFGGWAALAAASVWLTGCPNNVAEVPAGSGSGTDTESGGATTDSSGPTSASGPTSESDSATSGTDSTTAVPLTTGPSSTTDSTDPTGPTGPTDPTDPGDTTSTTTGGSDTETGSTTVVSSSSSSTGDPECDANADCDGLEGPCVTASCVGGVCVTQDLPNDDPCQGQDLCMENQTCTAGVCGGGNEIDCSDLDGACTVGQCQPANGTCVGMPVNEGNSCSDGDACTYLDECVLGSCEGVSDPLLSETFADDSGGWSLEGKWEIGPAMVSGTGSFSGLTDPDDDHTPGGDAGLAGVLIGGLSGSPSHPPQYLLSPQVDLSVIEDGANKELRFWRHLVTDTQAMTETIEFWDGSNWQTVFQTNSDVYDDDWTQIVIDLDDYDNADFQVRFGHQFTSGSAVHEEPSWSIDDVSVLACPP